MENTQLKQIQNKLEEVFNPKEIYLFGSYAWGEPSPESDVDFCVILSESEEKPYFRIKKGLSSLHGIDLPVDLLVYTESEIAEKKNHPSTLIYKIIHDGVKVFEAS